jgi:hypothetical protein
VKRTKRGTIAAVREVVAELSAGVADVGPSVAYQPPRLIARVRFLASGDIVSMDFDHQAIPALSAQGPVHRSRKHLARILDAARSQSPRPQLEENSYGRFRPLTEQTLAIFEGRDMVGERDAVVQL